MGALTDRRDSDYEGEDTNLNVQLISHPLFWVFYIAIIAVLRWALFFVPESYITTEHAWTAWNLIHAVVRIPTVYGDMAVFLLLRLDFVPLCWFRCRADALCLYVCSYSYPFSCCIKRRGRPSGRIRALIKRTRFGSRSTKAALGRRLAKCSWLFLSSCTMHPWWLLVL
jgi:hypothetical protein